MIVKGWHDLQRAVDHAVPCYTPVAYGPHGTDGRCGTCQGCKDYDKVEAALTAVETAIEEALAEAAAGRPA